MKNQDFVPEAAIFDMDGLMLDTERPGIPAWIAAGKKYGIEFDENLPLSVIGQDRPTIKRIFMETLGEDIPYEEIKGEMKRIVLEKVLIEGIPHRPGLLSLLDHLRTIDIPLAVATSTDRVLAEARLTQAGIKDRFKVLVGGDEVKRGKPNPDIFLLAAEKLKKDPSVCVGFEDSPAGLRSLTAAGIRSVFIKDLVEPSPEILSTVWRRFDNLAEAVSLFPYWLKNT